MIKHIFKIIWTERRINAWILFELILVFAILWFCWNYVFNVGKEYFQPVGVDTNYTYSIKLSINRETVDAYRSGDENVQESMRTIIWNIYDQLKINPKIENVSLSTYSIPLKGSYYGIHYYIDSLQYTINTRHVTPDYFNVFKINFIQGKVFNSIQNEVVICGNTDGLIRNNGIGYFNAPTNSASAPDVKIEDIKSISYYQDDDNMITAKVVGVANKMKRVRFFEGYQEMVYLPLLRDDYSLPLNPEICIRIKPNAEKNFISEFKDEMLQILNVYPYFFSDIQQINSGFKSYKEVDKNIKSISSISLFLIVNVVLGIIGTFWFRIQSRRKDIGLRISLGASKSSVKSMFISESLLLLFLASIISTIICINISFTDLFRSMNMFFLIQSNPKIEDIITNYLITFIPLSITTILSVWYPAKKASDIQPTEALHDE
ncbi:FtsX-like permease family protein [Bacteroidales bacterium OttesenSCG-928-C19]|nr:FtsX-like permease family protein [Bacteroidales bacterium OttesenSCG-928-C19]